MRTHLTPADAWQEFYIWIRLQPAWTDLPPKERKRIYDAQSDFMERRGKRLGVSRIRSLLEKYAHGVYEFHAGEPYFVKK